MVAASIIATASPLPLDLPSHDELGRLCEFWQRQRGSDAMPSDRSIRPEELSFMLGRINLVEVFEAPRRYRFRLAGTTVSTNEGREFHGLLTEAIKPPLYRALVEAHFAEAFDGGRPTLYAITVGREAVERHYRRLILPFRCETAGVAGLLMTGSSYTEDLRAVIGHPDFVNG